MVVSQECPLTHFHQTLLLLFGEKSSGFSELFLDLSHSINSSGIASKNVPSCLTALARDITPTRFLAHNGQPELRPIRLVGVACHSLPHVLQTHQYFLFDPAVTSEADRSLRADYSLAQSSDASLIDLPGLIWLPFNISPLRF